MNLPRPRGKELAEQVRRAGVVFVPDRVLQADFVDALVGHTGEIGNHRGHLGKNFFGAGIGPFCGGTTQLSLDALGQVADDLPVSADCPRGGCAARTRWTRRSVLVKVPSFSAKGVAGRKTSAKAPDSLMNKSWATRNSKCLHVFAGLVQVGLGHHRVLAHDVERPHAAGMGVPQNFGGGQAELAAQAAGLDVPGGLPFFGVVFVADQHVAGVMEGHGAHVAGALDVVLSTQRVEAGAFAPDVAGEKSEMDERQGAGRAVRQLRDTHAPVDGAVFGVGVQAGGFADVIGRDAGDGFGILGGELFEALDELVEALGAVLDELVVDQPFLDDDVRHRSQTPGHWCPA